VLLNGEPVPKAVVPSYIGANELDAVLLEEMAMMGFDPEAVAASVRGQHFDGMCSWANGPLSFDLFVMSDNAATYYLLCARQLRQEQTLVSIQEDEAPTMSTTANALDTASSHHAKRSRPVKAAALTKHEEAHQRRVRTWDEKNLKAQQEAKEPPKVAPAAPSVQGTSLDIGPILPTIHFRL